MIAAELALSAHILTSAVCGVFADANPEDLSVHGDQNPNVSFGVMVDRGEHVDPVYATVDVMMVGDSVMARAIDENGGQTMPQSLEGVLDDLVFEHCGPYGEVVFAG